MALGLAEDAVSAGGEARDVVEDIAPARRVCDRGASRFARSRNCRWTDWDAPVDGIEWLNADSEWRDERPWTLARALLTYPFRPPQTLALLLDRPEPVIRSLGRVLAAASCRRYRRGGCARAGGFRSLGEPYDSAGSLHFPSYDQFLPRVLDRTARRPIERRSPQRTRGACSMRSAPAHVYSTIDALAGPAAFSVTATSGVQHCHDGRDAGARRDLFTCASRRRRR